MRSLMLDEVAERTGESVARLRRWCATGRLRGDREGGAWTLSEGDLPEVRALGAERRRRIAANGAMGLVVPAKSVDGPALAARVEHALGLPHGSVATTILAVDDQEYALAIWPVSIATGEHALEMLRVAEDIGGDLLDWERVG